MYVTFHEREKRMILERIQRYFLEERNETVGELAALQWFDFITEQIGPYYYNQAIKDARSVVNERITAVDEDLLSLRRPVEE
ncbi:MAG TPA: DUF2164 domain-containing protein [Bacillales bacterium]|nr:DUF2164 domain-containing protein [Bacillales bacterium]